MVVAKVQDRRVELARELQGVTRKRFLDLDLILVSGLDDDFAVRSSLLISR